MHIIVREGWHDADYISRYAEGFDELQKRLAGIHAGARSAVDRHCEGRY